MAEISEPLDLKRASRDRFARIAATCAVLATLAGAAIGYLQSEAGQASDRAGTDSKVLSVKTFGELARLKAAARIQVELFIRSQVLRARAASALEQELVGPPEDRSSSREERRRSLALARAIDARASRLARQRGITAIGSDARFSPSEDLGFPGRYVAAVVERRVSELQALRDAANREAAERGKQVSAYVAILALLAVSVYLFGFSLTPHGGENRAVFVGAAGALSVIGLGWAVAVLASGYERAPPAAAAELARADEALLGGRYARAERLYKRAIELDPDSGHAYFGRSSAAFFANSPDYQLGGAAGVLTSPEALRKSTADAKRALELGSSDQTLLGNAGFQTIMLGAEEGSEALIREGLAMTREAERQPRSAFYPLDSYTVGFGSLLLGDRPAARRAYRRAIRRSLPHGPSGKFWNPNVLRGLVAFALTELERLGRLQGAEGGTLARAFKQEIVRRAWGAAPGASATPPGAQNPELSVTPQALELRLDGYPWAPRDRVVVVWYRRDPELGWYTLPEAAGLTNGPVDFFAPGVPREFEWSSDTESGEAFIRRYQLRDFYPACLAPALYKAEVYVNGRLALTKIHRTRDRPGIRRLVPVFDRGTGYRICRRPGWRPARETLPGLVTGFVDREKQEGVYVLRLSIPPDDAREAGSDPYNYVSRRIGRALDDFSSVLPSRPGPPWLVERTPIGGGMSGEVVKGYRDADGQMIAWGGITLNDSVLVAVAFGPRGLVERGRLAWTGQSLAPP